MRLDITRATDIAVRAVQHLATAHELLTASTLAAHAGTTPGFLSQPLGRLVRLGWLASEPGPKGGYRWAVEPADLSVLDLVEALEGEVALSGCVLAAGSCRDKEPCLAHDAWRAARDVLVERLGKVSLASGGALTASGRS